MKLGWTAKLMMLFSGLYLFIYLIGLTISRPEPRVEPWKTKVNVRAYQKPTNIKQKIQIQIQTSSDYDWQTDKDNETIEWQEFLEEVENMGLTPYDAGAVELWDNNYR